MKKIALQLTAISSLFFAAGSLAAAPSAEIKVTGQIVAPACEVKLTNGGVVDLGTIDPMKISASEPVWVGGGRLGLNVTCEASSPVTFKVTDNRPGTASMTGPQYLGVGSVNQTGKLGFYLISMSQGKVDGKNTQLFSTSGSSLGGEKGVMALEIGKRHGWSSNTQMLAGKSFSATLETSAYLAKRSDMHGGVGEDTRLDGSATLEFGFGL